MDTHTAPLYIRQNFRPDDRLAVVLIRKGDAVEQRIASAAEVASDPFQSWLRWKNKDRHELYVSMNALRPEAGHRTKQDIARIRHVYLDFDDNGTEAVRALRRRTDIPTPNHILESSPGRYQTIWRVDGFELRQAEQLMRGMVRELGADPAATDASRVMRLPAFYNHKREVPHFIRVETYTDTVYQPASFPAFGFAELHVPAHSAARGHTRAPGAAPTQSERDWVQIKRSLARGADPAQLVETLAAERSDKPNPSYYARLTVSKAAQALAEERERCNSAQKHPGHQNGLGIGG